MDNRYNTIIIGAGPAGLNAARFLKEKTLVLDKKQVIGLPVQCGEGISFHALQREGIEPDDQWIATYIRQVKRIMPNGKFIGERHDDPYALVLRRDIFEQSLAGLVPWEIRMNTRVTGIRRSQDLFVVETEAGDRFQASNLIGSDGPNSLVGRSLFHYTPAFAPGINHVVSFNSPIPDDELRMYFGNRIAPSGYGWFFPLSNTRANVGVLIKEKGNIKHIYDNFLTSVIKPGFGDFEIGENKSGVLPTNGFYQAVSKDNAFLIGDAGAFTDPIFEGGINMALLTGRLCAEGINTGNADYYQNCVDDLPVSGRDLVAAQRIFYGFSDDVLNDLGDVIDGHGTSHLNTDEGQKTFAAKPNLIEHQSEIAQFARTWQLAKPYIW
jgi:digeranylgeranylglycerophospholipid reductase